ncbi:MAG: cupin domain-containing protein [Lachnospiraceae bacterium]|nr:cupin domain-containing protein [Lachnospiraceae bacterium]
MNVVLLSGGSGKRLWPLSNDVRSKQFIKLFKREDGTYESMVQRMLRGLKGADPSAKITIATSKTQLSEIRNQLGEEVDVSIEPDRRDTFPAIVLSCMYLHDKMGVKEDEAVVICPVDPYVEDCYFDALKNLNDLALKSSSNLCLLGMEPTYPSAKYGYIIPKDKGEVSEVLEFKEKPSEEVAAEYIKKGALWNGGVFAFRLGYILSKAHELLDFTDYDNLYQKFSTVEKISFDYAVAEKEDKISVMRFNGTWKDLGTWNTLTESIPENIIGKGIMNEECKNVHIINELNVPILTMGLSDVVISASAEGILISDKHQSSYIKPFVDDIVGQVMFAEKSWGSFRVLNVEDESMTILVTLNPGHSMNYHAHKMRDEVCVVIEGNGTTIVDGMRQDVKVGDVITMQAGCRHTVIANDTLKIVEVQLGKEISVYDKQKYELE